MGAKRLVDPMFGLGCPLWIWIFWEYVEYVEYVE